MEISNNKFLSTLQTSSLLFNLYLSRKYKYKDIKREEVDKPSLAYIKKNKRKRNCS